MMDPVTQVAFQLPDEDLQAIDKMVPDQFPSRAEALRRAVKLWLKHIEEQRIDAALTAGYDLIPPKAEERDWAEASVEALAGAHLDW